MSDLAMLDLQLEVSASNIKAPRLGETRYVRFNARFANSFNQDLYVNSEHLYLGCWDQFRRKLSSGIRDANHYIPDASIRVPSQEAIVISGDLKIVFYPELAMLRAIYEEKCGFATSFEIPRNQTFYLQLRYKNESPIPPQLLPRGYTQQSLSGTDKLLLWVGRIYSNIVPMCVFD